MAKSFSLTLKEELALLRAYIWHRKRDENRLRRKLSSIESKIEQSRNQLRHVLKFMKQHQNGIDVHLKKLSKTENTLREQIDNIFHEDITDTDLSIGHSIDSSKTNSIDHSIGKTKQTKRAKILNKDLIEIVQHRNDHESRRDSSQSTFKLISSLLNDETKSMDNIYNINGCDLVLELDDNISEYIYYRQQMSSIQSELVECVEKRELANHSQYKTHKLLNKHIISNRCRCGQCECKHKDEILIHDYIYSDDDDDVDDNNNDINNKEILKKELIKLGQDIHQRSGLIRQQRRDGICHLRVFVGSELITWMVKSDIVKTRYEASILSSLLINNGYVYCAYKYHHNNTSKKCKSHKNIKILNKNPSISLKPISSSTVIKTQKTPNKLLSSTNTSSNTASSSSCSSSESVPSSVLSIASSLSTISATSGTSSCSFASNASSTSSCSFASSVSSPSCGCCCIYCKSINYNLSFHDNNDLYRFKVDDSRIERISKMGYLDKFGRFRSKKRHYIWDGVRRQLREYMRKGDPVPLYKYSFTKDTQIVALNNDECGLSIIISPNNILKLGAANTRERDSWMRVFITIESTINISNISNIDNVDSNYEEYRHLRMVNRLKWSSLIKSVKPTSNLIKRFREFMIKENKLQKCHKTDIEREINKLFTNKESAIYRLFNSFNRLFLEPFDNIDIDELSAKSVDIIITLCVDDLTSFLEIAQNRLINLLLPVSLRMDNKESKPRPVIKLLYKVIKPCIYCLCFSSSVYNTIFPLYQRVHHDIDDKLHHISMSVYNLSTKEYHISDELQIDREWNKNNMLKLDATNDIEWNQVTKLMEYRSIPSPFQPCFDKMTQLSRCHTPTKKLQCLVELQQQIIKCIDNYRRHNDDDIYFEEQTNEIMANNNDNDIRTHGVMSDDEDDVNVSLISYESSTTSSLDNTKKTKNKKCKQLLIASDDMIPIFCYVLVQSEIQSVHAEIAFMNDFMSDDEKQMKTGFYLTTLQAATSALLDRKLPTLL